jgi:NAD(P)-dependent dehydrogenase (short-subunit alcohol dehydrogenase family)
VTGRLDEVTAVVTGCGSGIGRAVADAYLASGAAVVAVERSAEAAEKLRIAHPDRVRVVTGDAVDRRVLETAVRTGRDLGRPAAQLTCCVGLFDNYASLRELTPAQLVAAGSEIWSANVLSALLAVDIAFSWLRDGRGSVTLTLSESAYHAVGGGVLYGSSKWALRGAIAHLAADLAPDVRVNGVAPGGTTGTAFAGQPVRGRPVPAGQGAERDERIRSGNVLRVLPAPADHAGAYVYLADPEAARVVTGVIVNTDGGRR